MISATPVHWLDGNDASTVIQSGGLVTAWNDKSGSSRDATAVTTGTGAITYDSVNKGIVFSGNSSVNQEYFSTTSATDTLYKQTAFTIFAVETRSGTEATSLFYGSWNTSGTNNLLHVGYTNNTAVRLGFFSNDQDYTSAELANSQRRLWAFRLPAAGSRTIRYFGSVVSTLGNVTQLVNNANTIQIGRYRTSGWYNGTLHEIIGYHGDLTDAEVEQMEGFLAWKWGLQMDLPSSHPYSPVSGNIMFPTGSRVPRADTSCFSFFNFLEDTTSSTSLTDLSPNSNNFERKSATFNIIGGRRGIAMPAEGSALTAYPVLTQNSMISTNTFTWCSWVYMTQPITPGAFHTLFFTRSGTVTGLQIDALDSYKVRYTWGNNFWQVKRNLTVDLNTWTHVAVTISPTQALFYKNGILVDTVANTHNSQTFNQLYIGNDPNNPPLRFFPGYLDDIAIYTRVLTGIEILQLSKFGPYLTAQTVTQVPRPFVTSNAIDYYWDILDYSANVSSLTLVVTSNSNTSTIPLSPSATMYTLSNLSQGTNVSGYIYQVNTLNATSPLADYRQVTTGNLPSAPQSVSYTSVGSNRALIEWQPPASDGGASLLGYVIQNNDESIRLSAKAYHFSRLTPMLSTGIQQFSVQAVNDPGYGPKTWTTQFTIPFT